MTKFNDFFVDYAEKRGLPEDRESLLDVITDAVFDAERRIEDIIRREIQDIRERKDWAALNGVQRIVDALGYNMEPNLFYPFQTDEHGRPIVYGRPAGAAFDGYAIGRNECFSYVNYAVIPGTGLVYIEGAIDNPSYCDTTTVEVVPLDDAEDCAVNILYEGFDVVMSYAYDGVSEDEADDPEDAEREDERTIERLREDIRRDVEAERARNNELSK